ncbi:MAG: hypothetical protein LUH19_09045 [Lachnospiraceae bacterium]|nr:hypothetical protein [Lachnospiraceae bacterium]
MKLKLYVMDIRELERADLCERALRLLDPVRKEKAMKAGNEKDRARSVGAGLLLLLGYVNHSGRNEDLQILSPTRIIQTIEDEEKKRGRPLAEGICYEISDAGKPAWKGPHFNLSHSGNYAVLVTGDVLVGIDVQEPRRVLHKSIGSYHSFCKLESYLKCTGRGIGKRIDACYAELKEAEESGEYYFRNIPMPDEYDLWICARIDKEVAK